MPKIFKELIPFNYKKLSLTLKYTEAIKKRNPSIEVPVIVSLTTIASRLDVVHYTILSILSQDKKPEKIVLWIYKGLKDKIPQQLKNLEGEVFEIAFSEIDCPHLKLVESMNKYPDANIITIDDDQIYPAHFIDYLYKCHKAHPKKIIANSPRLITYDENDNLSPYQKWPYTKKQPVDCKNLLPLGVYGVLYPPYSLDERYFDMDLINKLSPKADDLWFKAMSMIKGTEIYIPKNIPNNPVLILGTQEITLKHHNIGEDKNRKQWGLLVDYFGITL